MPFVSKAQQRFMFAAEARGDVKKGTAKRWADETKNIKKLPEKIEKKASACIDLGRLVAQDLIKTGAIDWGKLLSVPKRGMSKGIARKFKKPGWPLAIS